jgi:cell fate regulator YaaT (PSP1 superfamily)
MPTVVAVRFREAGRLYHFDPGSLSLHRLDRVVVETANGPGLGRVVTEPMDKPLEQLSQPLRRVLRRAGPDDVEQHERARARAAEALDLCRQLVGELGLEMRPTEAECTLDLGKVTIAFTAEQRVDFRRLVRDLSARLRCRVELRQIGARDEAKALDGIGPCGQRLCCSRWLTEFQPVSIKMAKYQNLALNPGKLAGMCGRLKCCLRYELENYEEAERELPRLGATVYTREGEGRVVGLRPLERMVQVLVDQTPHWLPRAEVFDQGGCQGGTCGTGAPSGGCACRTGRA